MATDLDGQRVLVTGASSGIGAATAIEFARQGAIVGACARRAGRLQETVDACAALGATTHHWVIDLADLDGLATFADQVVSDMGGLDILVNNAGVSRRRRMQEITVAEFNETMDINFNSPMRLTLALLPHMLERDSGHIVNVGSSGTRKFPPRVGSYVAAKAAIDAFTEGLYIDLAPTNVKAHLFIPGGTATEFSNDRPGQDAPFPTNPDDLETPENVAKAIVACLSSEDFESYPNNNEIALAAEKRADFNGYLAKRRSWFRK